MCLWIDCICHTNLYVCVRSCRNQGKREREVLTSSYLGKPPRVRAPGVMLRCTRYKPTSVQVVAQGSVKRQLSNANFSQRHELPALPLCGTSDKGVQLYASRDLHRHIDDRRAQVPASRSGASSRDRCSTRLVFPT